jgi:type II secretion system protein J
MSPANDKRCIARGARRAVHGFTLVEILVAVAIFLSVFVGVALLFSGAVDSLRTGMQIVEGTETGRAALEVMERDLKVAFTDSERDGAQSFYGNGTGFVFTGVKDGALTRITYAVRWDQPPIAFPQSRISPLDMRLPSDALNRISLRTASSPGERITVALNAEMLRNALIDSAKQVAQLLGYDPAFAETNAGAAWNNAGLPSSGTHEFTLQVHTMSLIRLEETIDNLDDFPAMPRIHIDPEDADNDWVNNPDNNNLPDPCFGMDPESSANYAQGFLYGKFRGVLRPGCDPSDDMRNLMRNINEPPRMVTPSLIRELVRARQRSLWVELVSNTLRYPLPFGMHYVLLPLDALAVQEFTAKYEGKFPRDYVVAENIVGAVYLVLPDDTLFSVTLMHTPPLLPVVYPVSVHLFDVLGHPTFDYYDTEGVRYTEFNDVSQVPGLFKPAQKDNQEETPPATEAFLTNADPDLTDDMFKAFDRALSDLYRGTRTAAEAGGIPLFQQIPAAVEVKFWIYLPRPTVGGKDFLRRFVQRIEIPAGKRRAINPQYSPVRDTT